MVRFLLFFSFVHLIFVTRIWSHGFIMLRILHSILTHWNNQNGNWESISHNINRQKKKPIFFSKYIFFNFLDSYNNEILHRFSSTIWLHEWSLSINVALKMPTMCQSMDRGYAKFHAEPMDILVLCLRSIKLNFHLRSFDDKVILTAIHY